MTLAEEMDDETTAGDEKAPFLQTTEERVAAKIKAHKLTLPDELLKFIEDKGKGEVEKGDEVEETVEDPTIHYDKEDLISFHQLFISKPLTKAAHDLDYEHPTVI